jgi:hypothetical protein
LYACQRSEARAKPQLGGAARLARKAGKFRGFSRLDTTYNCDVPDAGIFWQECAAAEVKSDKVSLMTRRQFAFWVSFGLFSLAEKLRAEGLDRLAAATMRATESKAAIEPSSVDLQSSAEHWSVNENRTWRWFERENYVKGKWRVTGITTPINKETGERYTEKTGYLDDDLVPEEMRLGESNVEAEYADAAPERDAGKPNPARRARHGRPPSKWLRSLKADELRIWMKTIDVPEAGVEGITYWEHLTRDHYFHADRIAGLTITEQAKLHAAAHFGY